MPHPWLGHFKSKNAGSLKEYTVEIQVFSGFSYPLQILKMNGKFKDALYHHPLEI